MENKTEKIKSFTDLRAWKETHKLVLMVYKITKEFPREEMFGLTSQMRSCVISISSNIAEGFSRYTIKDKQHFYSMSRGSLTELQNQLLIARDVGYLTNEIFQDVAKQTIEVNKLLSGLKRIGQIK